MFTDLIGKPFEALGRGPDGYDCWGLVMEVSKRFGQEVPDYGIDPGDLKAIHSKYYEVELEYDVVNVPKEGDIVLYKRMDGGLHFGIMINSSKMIHVSRSLGVHKIDIHNPVMKQLIQRIYRNCR